MERLCLTTTHPVLHQLQGPWSWACPSIHTLVHFIRPPYLASCGPLAEITPFPLTIAVVVTVIIITLILIVHPRARDSQRRVLDPPPKVFHICFHIRAGPLLPYQRPVLGPGPNCASFQFGPAPPRKAAGLSGAGEEGVEFILPDRSSILARHLHKFQPLAYNSLEMAHANSVPFSVIPPANALWSVTDRPLCQPHHCPNCCCCPGPIVSGVDVTVFRSRHHFANEKPQ